MSSESMQLWLTTEVEIIETTEVVWGERESDNARREFAPPQVTEQVKTIVRQRVPLDALALKTQMNGLLQTNCR